MDFDLISRVMPADLREETGFWTGYPGPRR